MNKTFNEWEKHTGWFASDSKQFQSSKQFSDEEFIKIVKSNRENFSPVNYPDRIKFLKDNNYEITRENLLNSELSMRSE